MKPAEYLAAFERRALRERLMIVGVAIAVLAAAADALWTAPLEKRLRRARNEAQALQAQWDKASGKAAAAAAAAEAARQQEQQLRQRLQAAQQASSAVRERVADAARLPQALRAIVATVGSARLLELDLSGAAPVPAAAASAAGAQRLYRLPISLKVSGSWDELQLLLAQIERHADALQWTALTLDGGQWPAIQLTLKAHVLSLDPRWGAS